MTRDIENFDIKNFLPHRKPMLLVDKLLSLSENSVTSSYLITKNSIFINKKNHFLESGLIENSAQTCSAIIGQNFFEDDDLKGEGNKVVGFISTIKKSLIYKLPLVNDTIKTKAILVSKIDMGEYIMCTMDVSTFNNEDLIVDCTMNLIIREA